MAEIIHILHYRTAYLLMNILHDRAEAHAERMIRTMTRKANMEGQILWQAVSHAIAELRRKRDALRRWE